MSESALSVYCLLDTNVLYTFFSLTVAFAALRAFMSIMLLSKNAEYTSVIGISSFSLDVVTFLRFARRIYDNSFSSAL